MCYRERDYSTLVPLASPLCRGCHISLSIKNDKSNKIFRIAFPLGAPLNSLQDGVVF